MCENIHLPIGKEHSLYEQKVDRKKKTLSETQISIAMILILSKKIREEQKNIETKSISKGAENGHPRVLLR